MKKNNEDALHAKFVEAVTFVNDYNKPFPADTLLKLYAYFKIANKNFNHPKKSRKPLINAFKANALIQARNLDPETAMELYIELVDKEIRFKS